MIYNYEEKRKGRYLGIIEKTMEIDRPSSEKEEENVKSEKSNENNGSISEVERGKDDANPECI